MKKHKFSEWEIELKNFNKLVRNVLGRRIPVKTVPEAEDQLGYTNAKPEIFIAKEHPIMNELSQTGKKMLRMGVLAHEMLHQIFSDFSLLEKEAAKYSTTVEQQLFATLFNIVEDCNIEYYSSTVMGGVLLKALRFSIKHIYDKSPKIDAFDDPLTQVINALIQLGDMGIVKGNFSSTEAYEIFAKCAVVFNEGVNAREPQGRCDAAKKMMEITKPLWEEEKLSEEEYRKMLESLSKMAAEHSEASGSGKSSSGTDKSSTHAEGSPSGSAASSRREEMVRAISKTLSDAKKSADKKDESTSASAGASKSCSEEKEKSDAPSTSKTSSGEKPAGETADDGFELLEDGSSKKMDETSGEELVFDFDETKKEESSSKKSESEESEHSSCAESESKEEKSPESEKIPDEKKDEDSATDSEKSDSETLEKSLKSLLEEAEKKASEDKDADCEISEKDEKELESLEKDAESSLLAEEDAYDFGSIDLTVEPTLYDGEYSVYNRDVKPIISEGYQSQYSDIVSEYGTAIQAFAKKLERLFKNQADTKEYRNAGKLNIKRYSSSKVTARIFDKKVSPKDIDDLSVFVLVDESGSMNTHFSPENKKTRMDIARETAICFAETFGKLNIPLYVMGFSGEDHLDVDHYHYIKWKNTSNARMSLLGIHPKRQNFDAMSINIAHETLKKRHSAHKLLIVLSDGAPYCTVRERSKLFVETKDEIRKTRKDGIDVLGIAIGNSDTKELQTLYGKNFFHTTDVKTVFTGATKEIMKMVQSW